MKQESYNLKANNENMHYYAPVQVEQGLAFKKVRDGLQRVKHNDGRAKDTERDVRIHSNGEYTLPCKVAPHRLYWSEHCLRLTHAKFVGILSRLSTMGHAVGPGGFRFAALLKSQAQYAQTRTEEAVTRFRKFASAERDMGKQVVRQDDAFRFLIIHP